MKMFIALSICFALVHLDLQGQASIRESCCERSGIILVPFSKKCNIKTDGLFPDSEWKGALRFNISESFELLLLSSSENLYIGLKYAGKLADYAQPLDCVSEVYISANDDEFYNLHSSARLAEGINKFSDTLKQAKYIVEDVNGWEANSGSHVRDNELNCKGVEFKISLNKIGSRSFRLAGGIMAVNFTVRESGNFPENFGFNNNENWLELVLPDSISVSD